MADGEYVQNGDVSEWQWAARYTPESPVVTAGWVVPEAEFDPTSAPEPDVSPAEQPLEEPSPGLTLVPEPEAPAVEAKAAPEPKAKTTVKKE